MSRSCASAPQTWRQKRPADLARPGAVMRFHECAVSKT
jgi:hypothetical protein